jgi:hypothetical protein
MDIAFSVSIFKSPPDFNDLVEVVVTRKSFEAENANFSLVFHDIEDEASIDIRSLDVTANTLPLFSNSKLFAALKTVFVPD